MRFSKILYVVLLYAYAGVMAYPTLEGQFSLPTLPSWFDSDSAWLCWMLVLLLAGVVIVVDSGRNGVRHDSSRLLRGMSWFKFVLIPFFVFNFVYLAMLVLGVSAVAVMFAGILGTLAVGWATGVVVVLMTYLVFLPTSADGIAFLIEMRRRRQIGIPAFVLHLVLHLLFVADLVSTVILLVTYWKKVVSGRDSAPVGAVEATA